MSAIIAVLGGVRASLFACLLLVTLGVLSVQTARWDHQQRAWLREKLAASQALVRLITRQREMERRHAVEMAAIGERYEQDKAASHALELDVVNSLRHGAVRLRRAWTQCQQQLSQGSAATGQRHAPAPDRAALAGAIIRAGRDRRRSNQILSSSDKN